MIIKIKLNPETLEITLEDSEVVINEIEKLNDGQIFIELSKQDTELVLPTGQ